MIRPGRRPAKPHQMSDPLKGMGEVAVGRALSCSSAVFGKPRRTAAVVCPNIRFASATVSRAHLTRRIRRITNRGLRIAQQRVEVRRSVTLTRQQEGAVEHGRERSYQAFAVASL